MIPAIGFIVGVYVIARAAEMMELPKPVVRILAGLSAVVALLGLAVLYNANGTSANALRQLIP